VKKTYSTTTTIIIYVANPQSKSVKLQAFSGVQMIHAARLENSYVSQMVRTIKYFSELA